MAGFLPKFIKRGMAPLALCAISIGSAAAQTNSAPPNPALHVQFNQIVDPTGALVTLRGVAIVAPEANAQCHNCNNRPVADLIAQLSGHQASDPNWAARVVRIPVQTSASDPPTSFTKWIKPSVDAAKANGLYAIIDLHFVQDFGGSQALAQSEVLSFWDYVSKSAYANDPNVLFELFNEPVNPDDWTAWTNYIVPVVDKIRANGANNIILMGSPQWSTRAYQALTTPIPDPANNLVYVEHIYPNQGTGFDALFGTASHTIPIMVTEFGWDPSRKSGGAYGTSSGWGSTFRRYMDANPQMGWSNWIFSDYWTPVYFDTRWNLLGGDHEGAFVKQWFWDQKNCNQPQATTTSVTPNICNPLP
jgi:hypothetical protein